MPSLPESPSLMSLHDLSAILGKYRRMDLEGEKLGKDAELRLFEALVACRSMGLDEHARRFEGLIFRATQGLVISAARKLVRGPMMSFLPDLVGEGNMMLLKAIRGFNPSLGYRFSSYAMKILRRHLTMCLKRCLAEESRRLDLEDHAFNLLLNGEGRNGNGAIGTNPRSTRRGTGRGNGRETSEETEARCHRIDLVDEALEHLPHREVLIVRGRYFEDPPRSLGELAGVLGISRERVSQLEKQALGRLREILGSRKCL